MTRWKQQSNLWNLSAPMLEKPDLPDQSIAACLHDAYGLRVAQVAFLPLGADLNTAVYRAVEDDGTPYFVKLRRGDFDEIAVSPPKFLSDQGISQVIAPLPTQVGRLSADLDPVRVILYPLIWSRTSCPKTRSRSPISRTRHLRSKWPCCWVQWARPCGSVCDELTTDGLLHAAIIERLNTEAPSRRRNPFDVPVTRCDNGPTAGASRVMPPTSTMLL